MSGRLTQLLSEPVRGFCFIIGSSVAATLLAAALARTTLYSQSKTILPSPRTTLLPKLTKEEQDALAYPPDALPGGRDVESPYGTLRVYEFGPEDGRKVLMIHGISTPCLSLAPLAHHLVSKGCRVLLYDQFGRGYSDCPPNPQNTQLNSLQILLAVTSSPLPWTPDGFSIIGYSLGGGIAVDFAGFFPSMAKSLIVLAPGGLIRKGKIGMETKLLFSSYFPTSWLEWLVSRRLGSATEHPASTVKGTMEKPSTGDEVKGNRDPDFEKVEVLPGKSIKAVVQWQLDHHAGFVSSFCSSIRFGSLSGCEDAWRKLKARGDKILVMVGSTDSVINGSELKEDVFNLMGENGVEWRVVEGGHEFAITAFEEVAKEVFGFWEVKHT